MAVNINPAYHIRMDIYVKYCTEKIFNPDIGGYLFMDFSITVH